MSTYWYFHCRTDEAMSEDGVNHGEEMLREVAELWPHIDALRKSSWLCDVEPIGPYGASAAIRFYAEHKDHDVELQSEYGNVEPLVKEVIHAR